MLSTHDLRIINQFSSQSPLCLYLRSEIPKNLISSKTVNIKKYVWVEDAKNEDLNYEKNMAQRCNVFFEENNKLPDSFVRETKLIDTMLPNLTLNIGDYTNEGGGKITVTPCLSMGLLYENQLRDEKNKKLIKKNIYDYYESDFRSSEFLNASKGQYSLFNSKRFSIKGNLQYSIQEKEYIVLEVSLNNIPVFQGGLSFGIPSVTTFGMFVLNYLRGNLKEISDIPFAVGFYSIDYHSDNKNGKTSFYFVFESTSVSSTAHIIKKLSKDFKLGRNQPYYKNVYVSRNIPKAYWLEDMSGAVSEYIESNGKADALDAAIYFNQKYDHCIPLQVGFALMNTPRNADDLNHVYHPQSWAEPLHSVFRANYSEFSEKYFFKQTWDSRNLLFYWKQ